VRKSRPLDPVFAAPFRPAEKKGNGEHRKKKDKRRKHAAPGGGGSTQQKKINRGEILFSKTQGKKLDEGAQTY